MTRTRKIAEAKQLIYSSSTLDKKDADFMQKHGYKRQAYMFVYTPADKLKAEGILNKVLDSRTTVIHCSKDDMKL